MLTGRRKGKKDDSQGSLYKSKKKIRLFGTPLDLLVEAYGAAIPIIVRDCVQIIERESNTDNLFQEELSPAQYTKMKQLKKKFEESLKSNGQKKRPDIPGVQLSSALLKNFLSELPDPLLTNNLHQKFMDVARVPDLLERYLTIQNLVASLPQANKFLLGYLLAFFNRISEFSEVNGLTPHILGRVFGPLFLPPIREQRKQEDAQTCSDLVEVLVEQYSHSYIKDKPMSTANLSASASATKRDRGSTEPSATPVTGKKITKMRALYDFIARKPSELSFKKGDVIEVVYQDENAVGWWQGQLNGDLGMFPSNYCEVVDYEGKDEEGEEEEEENGEEDDDARLRRANTVSTGERPKKVDISEEMENGK
eukprot:TRINITY_DN17257_c0_g1_i1.p1 TRINITY_DN17257_c0_g1~~TRINITY_DN17257_c0_g1_i1.p1  ORF type:complete len:366 (-),score=99.27 TRINITY_DN17257_c0_g1_i1:143-1240(-)